MPVHVSGVPCGGAANLGLAVSWSDSQFVMIVAERGLVACGVIDKAVMERAGAAIAIARGTPERPLKTVEDLLSARIVEVTARAAAYGIAPGITGADALRILSGNT